MTRVRRAVLGACVAGALAAGGGGLALADPAGHTTFDETIRPSTGSAFNGVQTGPGEKYLVRQGVLGRAGKKRAKQRKSLIFFAQFSDVHIRDTQSPVRVDFVDPAGPPLDSAWRPAEAFSTQVFDQVVRNVNANKTSEVKTAGGKRAKLQFAITTGDNTDNQQFNELQWFSKVLAGGSVDPFSGKLIGPDNPCNGQSEETVARLNADVAARHYTGLQDYGDYPGAPADRYDGYWDPNQAPPDATSPFAAYPRYPGLMDRAQLPFAAQGLQVPYYISRGNHDGEIQGNLPATFALARGLIAGCGKIFPGPNFDPKTIAGLDEDELIQKFGDPQFQQQLLSQIRPAPPDPERRFVSAQGFRAAFAKVRKQAGYGYVSPAETRASKGAADYYAWSPRKGFRFISLDTVAEGGGQHGNLDNAQYKWLARELDKNSSVEVRGKKVVHDGDKDRLIVLYGHHSLDTLINKNNDEKAGKCASAADEAGCDRDPRKSTPLHLGLSGKNNVRDLLLRYPNVIAYVNGHRHANRIKPYKNKRSRTGFWEINTASHTDWPQQARLIEVDDNRDGTLSLFNTMVDSAAPVRPPESGANATAFSDAQIASIARVLSVNDPQSDVSEREGRHADRNTELVVRDPRVFDRRARKRR